MAAINKEAIDTGWDTMNAKKDEGSRQFNGAFRNVFCIQWPDRATESGKTKGHN